MFRKSLTTQHSPLQLCPTIVLHRVILWVAELELDTQVPCGIDSSPAGRATGRIVMHAWFLLFSSAMDVLLTRPATTVFTCRKSKHESFNRSRETYSSKNNRRWHVMMRSKGATIAQYSAGQVRTQTH
ncbi:Tyrosine--tRNA ligase [Fusarium oxysporum f. sp. albedinis]|nr:Tyrosine--tRNA ligase [Fusarium oxysporum f. sp. albedinis]